MAIIKRRALLAGLVGSTLTVLTTALWAAPKFLSGSITTTGEKRRRVVLKADNPMRYHYFTLSNPDRLVIDIDGMVQNQALMALADKVPANDELIARIRFGQKDAHTVRMVFDFKQPAQAHITQNHHQLSIDLQAATVNQATHTPTKSPKPSEKSSEKPSESSGSVNTTEPVKTTPPKETKSDTNPPATRKTRPIIMLDPGHGGVDPGALSFSGLKEKDVVFSVSQEVKKYLQNKGYDVHMTRETDVKIPLKDRRLKARDVNADLFISIHANATENRAVRGSSVFVWSLHANSEHARKLEKAENDADYVDGVPSVGNKNLDIILTDMMRAQTEYDSSRLGNQMLRRFARHGKVLQNKVGKGNFVVLRSLDIPSVLVELGFVSNIEDERLLASKAHQRNMAIAIAESVEHYFKSHA